MARRPTVQHWIACLEVQVVPPVAVNNYYDLLWVGPVHALPADTEFPASFARLDMFARFVGGRGAWEFEVEMVWVDSPDGESRVEVFGPQTVHFRSDEPSRDYNFRLSNVPLPGIGRYQFRLWSIRRGHRRLLAVEYLEVVRQP